MAPNLSRLPASAARHRKLLLPWLPPPRPEKTSTSGSSRSKPLTNAAVLRSITRGDLSTPKQLLSVYIAAARQPGFRHDYATYKALLIALARHRRFKLVHLLLSRMCVHDKISVGPGLLLPILDVYSASNAPGQALELVLSNTPIHEKVFCKLLSLLIDADQVGRARRLFEEDVGVKLGFGLKARHYVEVSRVYCDRGEVGVVVELLDGMAGRGVEMNVFGYGSLIGRLCRGGRVNQGLELVEHMRKRGKEPDLVIWNSLVHGFMTNGEIDKALGILKEMKERGIGGDTWTWNTLIGGICHHRNLRDGMEAFRQMRRSGVVPDVVTFTTLLAWSRRVGKVADSCAVLGNMVRMGILPDAACWRILVNVFCRDHAQVAVKVELEALFGVMNIPVANKS